MSTTDAPPAGVSDLIAKVLNDRFPPDQPPSDAPPVPAADTPDRPVGDALAALRTLVDQAPAGATTDRAKAELAAIELFVAARHH